MSSDPLVIFTPSGKRGRFAAGTPVLDAARQLGVDLDSVCGGRGICSKCQVSPSFGAFSKHGVTVADTALSDRNEVEARYDRVRGLKPGRRLGCQARIQSDVVIDVPPESQVHRQVVRKAASARPLVMDPATKLHLVTVPEPDMHEPLGDFERLALALREQWDEFWHYYLTGTLPPAQPRDIREIKDQELNRLLLEYRKVCDQMADLKSNQESLKEDIFKYADESSVSCNGIVVERVVRKGNVDWKELCEDQQLHDSLIEKFRKPSTVYHKIRNF